MLAMEYLSSYQYSVNESNKFDDNMSSLSPLITNIIGHHEIPGIHSRDDLPPTRNNLLIDRPFYRGIISILSSCVSTCCSDNTSKSWNLR